MCHLQYDTGMNRPTPELWSRMVGRVRRSRTIYRRAVAAVGTFAVFLWILPLVLDAGAWAVAVYCALMLGQVALFLLPTSWRGPRALTVEIAVLILLDLAFLRSPGAQASELLWPTAVFLCAYEGVAPRVRLPLFALVAVVTAVYFPLGIGNLTVFASLWLMYVWIRSARARRTEQQKLQRAHRELAELSLVAMQDTAARERLRIARDMHDGLGHRLTSLIVLLEAERQALLHGDDAALAMTERAIETARDTLHELRLTVKGLAEPDVSATETAMRGLTQTFANTTGIACEFVCAAAADDAWPQDAAAVLIRVLQEALTNVARHAAATRVTVTLSVSGDGLALRIEDDGSLTSLAELTPGFGLSSLVDRCKMAGGTVRWYIRQPHGFGLAASVPRETRVPAVAQ
jgi:signal transduction histidine kinase